MTTRTIQAVLACVMLVASGVAHAGAYKGLIERRAINDKSVTSRKEIKVQIKNYKVKGVKNDGLKMKSKLDGKNKIRPLKANSIHKVRVVKITKEDSAKKAKKNEKKGGK